MAMPKSLRISLVFLFSLLVWVVLFIGAGRSGFPARVFLSADCCRPGFELTRIAFENINISRPDYVIIGTQKFVKRIQRRFPESITCIAVPLQTLTLRQLGQAVKLFSEKNTGSFILQNAPHFWVDIDHVMATGTQDIRAWQLYSKSLTIDHFFSYALDSFDVLKSILSAQCQTPAKGYSLPSYFLWTSFLPEPMFSDRLSEFDASASAIGKTVWVFDPEWIPVDTMEDTRSALLHFAAVSKEIPNLGKFITIDKLNDYLKENTKYQHRGAEGKKGLLHDKKHISNRRMRFHRSESGPQTDP